MTNTSPYPVDQELELLQAPASNHVRGILRTTLHSFRSTSIAAQHGGGFDIYPGYGAEVRIIGLAVDGPHTRYVIPPARGTGYFVVEDFEVDLTYGDPDNLPRHNLYDWLLERAN